MNADQLRQLLCSYRFMYSNEVELHEAIADILADAGVDAAREVRLGAAGRIDFLAGTVGIEVKVQGATATVGRQLRRYAATPEVEELLLVTNRPRHVSLAGELPGTAVTVAVLL